MKSKALNKVQLIRLGVTYVSSDGVIYVNDKVATLQKSKRLKNGEFYYSVKLKGKAYYAHRVVYAWFNYIIDGGKVIHHLDENKLNNKITNLVMLSVEDHNKLHKGADV